MRDNILSMLLAGVLMQMPASGHAAVGAMEGSFEVGQSGAATYVLPIKVPPGTAGMAPELSLRYSSQGSNGVMGIGWSLVGLSQITRCAASVDPDGFNGVIRFDNDDRLCLDGARLVAISGNYGASGTEYRTEVEQFKKIVQHGGDYNSGTVWFEVRTRDGLIMEYGRHHHSSFVVPGKTYSLKWAVSRIADTLGSYIDIQYGHDVANNERYLHRINYTGNTQTSLAPHNSVRFEYETRPDIGRMHISGGSELLNSTRRLKNIKTYADSDLVTEYRLVYHPISNGGPSRLASVQECGATQMGLDCLPATEFAWTVRGAGLVQYLALHTPAFFQDYGGQIIDLDGDGLADLVQSIKPQNANQKIHTWINSQSGATQFWAWKPDYALPALMFHHGVRLAMLADLNGDSLPDFVETHGSGKRAWINTGSGWQLDSRYILPEDLSDASGNTLGTIADIDGDGLADVMTSSLRKEVGGTQVANKTWRNHGNHCSGISCMWTRAPQNDPPDSSSSGQGHMFRFDPVQSSGTQTRAWLKDMDGDGRLDYVISYIYADGPASAINKTWINTTSGWALSSQRALPVPLTIIASTDNQAFPSELLDVNGDGLLDVVCSVEGAGVLAQIKDVVCGAGQMHSNDHRRATYINDGAGFYVNHAYNLPEALIYYYSSNWSVRLGLLMDLNDDGKPDFIRSHQSITNATYINHTSATCSTESCKWAVDPAWAFPINIYNSAGPAYAVSYVPAHLDFDGQPDFIHVGAAPVGNAYIANSTGPNAEPPLMVREIVPPAGTAPMVEIRYSTLLDKRNYTVGAVGDYLNRRLAGPFGVAVRSNDGRGNLVYRYEDLRYDSQRRSRLGFAAFIREGALMNRRLELSQDFPYVGMVTRAEGDWKETINTLADTTAGTGTAKRYFPYIASSDLRLYDQHHTVMPYHITRTATGYDAYGNPTSITQTRFTGLVPGLDAYVTQTTNQYLNDTSQWILGRKTHNSEIRTGGSGPGITRESAFEYHPTTRLLTATITDPTHASLRVRTDYTHDTYGNILTATVSGTGIDSRTTTTAWDNRGRFRTSVSNPLGHIETYTNSPAHGGLLTLTGPHNVTTTWSYDALGRERVRATPDGASTTTEYLACTPMLCGTTNAGRFAVRATGSDGAVNLQGYDRYGRTVFDRTLTVGGYYTERRSEYDHRNRVTQSNLPDTSYQYDLHDRLTRTEQQRGGIYAPGIVVNQVAYNGLVARHTDPDNHVTEKRHDPAGQVTKIIDALNGVTEFEHDPYGHLLKTKDAANNISTRTYDLLGRKTATSDPNMGNWSYQYNVLGELISQTSAKSQTTQLAYDKLGRLTQRTEAEGVSTWTYDTRWIGKLTRETSPSPLPFLPGFERDYYYDLLGRVQEVRTKIGMETYSAFQTYDTHGRLDQLTYPSGFSVRHQYAPTGQLQKVINGTTSHAYWQLESMDMWGSISREQLGNGIKTCYRYDNITGRLNDIVTATSLPPPEWPCSAMSSYNAVQAMWYSYNDDGNLSSRTDLRFYNGSGIFAGDSYYYDALNRLSQNYTTGAAINIAYDAIGNITSKTDVGTYSYGARPNAVTQIAGPRAQTNSYDANGNLTYTQAGQDDYVVYVWTSFDKPYAIQGHGVNSSDLSMFSYGPDRARYVHAYGTTNSTSTAQGTIHYVGDIYETHWDLFINPTTLTKKIHYIRAGGRVVAMVTQQPNEPDETLYVHHDLLGSVDVLTDASGNQVERYNYDAFGKRIYSDPTWALDPTDQLLDTPHETHRGYTSHEHLDHLKLIHMNGRVYSPITGRFISADPYIPNLQDPQSHNRYSYVVNNPLRYTDPTGYNPDYSQPPSLGEIVVVGTPYWGTNPFGNINVPDLGLIGPPPDLMSMLASRMASTVDGSSQDRTTSATGTTDGDIWHTPLPGSGRLTQPRAAIRDGEMAEQLPSGQLLQDSNQEAPPTAQQIDQMVVTAARARNINGTRFNFNLPYPQEQVWVLYAPKQFVYLGILGEATGTVGTSRAMVNSGYIGIIHTHPNWAIYGPGPRDFGASVPVYGIAKDGTWVVRPGETSATRLYGRRP